MRKLFTSLAGLFLVFSLSPIALGVQDASPSDKVVARVVGRSITLSQLDTPSEKNMTEEQKVEQRNLRLSALIWQGLLEDYYRQNKVVATPAEVNAFSRAIFNRRTARGVEKTLAVEAVKKWKFDRAVYKQYGGTVIFQQSNPLEPVEAYRKFLEEQERNGSLEILDPALKQSFWEYYTGTHEMVMPPAEVNYNIPWWLQKPKK